VNGDEPEWVTLDDALLFHEQLIETFGGSHGVRDPGLLDSALARPRNVFAYESQDLSVLASAYAYGLAKDHPFVDGNKRMAFVVARVFLGLNRVAFDPPDAEAVVVVEALAAGKFTEEEFARWVRRHSKPRKR
jgi:death-on-curing protein